MSKIHYTEEQAKGLVSMLRPGSRIEIVGTWTKATAYRKRKPGQFTIDHGGNVVSVAEVSP